MKRMNSQKGQALILIALAAVGLFGFAALAIDGSRAYSDKRHAQNTADTSALAAALAHIKETEPADKFVEAKKAALKRALSNGYANNGTLGVEKPGTNVVIVELCSTATRACEGIPSGADKSKFIRVYIVSYLPTTFARVLGRPTVTNAAEAITMVTDTTSTSTAGGGRYGLQTLKPGCNPTRPTLNFTGSGDVIIKGSVGNNSCFDSSGSGDFHVTGNFQNAGDFEQNGGGDWQVDGNVWVGSYLKSGSPNWNITGSFFSNSTFRNVGLGDFTAGSLTAVGSATKVGTGDVSPWPKSAGASQTPEVLGDPYASVLNPPPNPGSCAAVSFGGSTPRTLDPGCYSSITKVGSGSLTLNPGIYYILGDFDVSGSGRFTAEGVLFYMKGGSYNVNGSGGMSISPYTSDPYKGLSIYVDRANSNPVDIIGSGGASFSGTVYAPASAFTLTGSGSTFVVDSQILAWTAELTGSGGLNLNYNPENNYNPGGPSDPTIELIK